MCRPGSGVDRVPQMFRVVLHSVTVTFVAVPRVRVVGAGGARAAPLRTLDGRRLVAGGRQAPTTGRAAPAQVRGRYSHFGDFRHFANPHAPSTGSCRATRAAWLHEALTAPASL